MCLPQTCISFRDRLILLFFSWLELIQLKLNIILVLVQSKKDSLRHQEQQGELTLMPNLFYKAQVLIWVSQIETFTFIMVFSVCCGSPGRGRMRVTFHLDITIRMWETFLLLKEKCQSFDNFLESKMVWVPRHQHEDFCFCSLPFIWLSAPLQGTRALLYKAAYIQLQVIQGTFQDNFDNTQFLHYMPNIELNPSKRSTFV